MSSVKYGLISSLDAECIEATLNYIMSDFHDEEINTCEVGVYSGLTSKGICNYIKSKKREVRHTGIENGRDKEMLLNFPKDAALITGDSNEVYNYLIDESQHFILIDALHTFPAVISDWYCYSQKVKEGGYIAFHDTGKHLNPLSGWQGVGDKHDPDFCLGGVRKALDRIGIIGNRLPDWKLIFDEADESDTGGGICIFKRIKIWD
jgi:hypothetical protein